MRGHRLLLPSFSLRVSIGGEALSLTASTVTDSFLLGLSQSAVVLLFCYDCLPLSARKSAGIEIPAIHFKQQFDTSVIDGVMMGERMLTRHDQQIIWSSFPLDYRLFSMFLVCKLNEFSSEFPTMRITKRHIGFFFFYHSSNDQIRLGDKLTNGQGLVTDNLDI